MVTDTLSQMLKVTDTLIDIYQKKDILLLDTNKNPLRDAVSGKHIVNGFPTAGRRKLTYKELL
jgi:hypothetical protein